MRDDLLLMIKILQGRTKYSVYPHPWRERLFSKKHSSFREGIKDEYGEEALNCINALSKRFFK